MAGSTFVYVTYIRTTPVKLWTALTDRDLQEKYWLGCHLESDWKAGSPWQIVMPGGGTTDAGEVLEIDPPRRLVLRWRHEFKPELKADGYSRCVFDLEPAGEAVKLTVTHSIDRDKSKLIEAVSGGWPSILSNLKSLLETGEVVVRP